MGTEDNITIGQRLSRIRIARDKSQQVVADRAGISKGYLSMLERGERVLDSLKLIGRLARALEIAPSELTGLPIPAPGNGHTDSSVEEVHRALAAVDVGRPGGMVLPLDVLADRVSQLRQDRRACRLHDVATALPGLIRDLHTSIDAGEDVAGLLELAVTLHVHVTRLWLKDAGAPVQLRREAAMLARQAAREHGHAPLLGAATFAACKELCAAGMFDLAQAELDSFPLPATTPDTAGLIGELTIAHSSIAALEGRAGDVAAPMEAAEELAARFGREVGEDDPLGFEFGPAVVGLRRMELALEAGEPDRALSFAEDVGPERLPFVTRQAAYWVDVGRAAARLRDRRDDAVRAFLAAEDLLPVRVYRNPFAREAIAGLVERTRVDAVGRDLRGLASRAGLNV